MTTFDELVRGLFADLFRASPVLASWIGNHDHDGAWPDQSEAGSRALVALLDRWTDAFRALPDGSLSADEAIDRDIVLAELAAYRFAETELRAESWDPLAWVYLLGDGIHLLLSREFAPLGVRLADAAARIEGLPAVLAAARGRLVGLPGRPVSRLHAEVALTQLPGIGELCREALAAAATADEGGELATVRTRLEPAVAAAEAALDAFASHLRDVVLPAAAGDGRLGPELYAASLHHTLRVAMTPEQLEARARREFDAVRAEMLRLARDLWPALRPGDPAPTDEAALVRGVLDEIALVHRTADDLLAFCRAELSRIEAFCRERDIVRLPADPLAIEWTPVFLRASGGAMLFPPGPLDRGLRSFFYVTPPPDDWTPEQVESYLREDNDRMLVTLVIHEAVPGHYLQLARANESPSLVRAAFSSGVFAEGWAVYVTQVMMDLGYRADDPALLLVHWKLYLRAVTNALVDVGIHARGMSEDEALALMVDGGFQERSEAVRKYERARLTSTQLSTYFVGSVAMWDLEEERRRRLAVASGDPRGAAAVPPPRVVGGFGETPGFAYREHLDAVLAHGTPPIPALRRILLGD
ncbi:MAG: DUF885 domain-containing protein [Chloroflexi bacterium]|nr:DUF885 domain-containing protein [Chloroflexota bacterium]